MERSEVLREQQRAVAKKHLTPAQTLQHVATIDELDPGAIDAAPNGLLIISHEFFDCLPAHAFEWRQSRWMEKYVAFDEEHERFDFVLRPLDANVERYFLDQRLLEPAVVGDESLSPELLNAVAALRQSRPAVRAASPLRKAPRPFRPPRAPKKRAQPARVEETARDTGTSSDGLSIESVDAAQPLAPAAPELAGALALRGKDGDYLELSFEAMTVFEHTMQLLRAHGGLQLLIDYGNFAVRYPSLRFIAGHKLLRETEVDSQFFAENIGKVDMSVDVHFAPLMAIAHKHKVKSYLSTQRAFLFRCGLQALLFRRLAKCADEDKAKRQIADFERLTAHSEMGRVYKVLENEVNLG